MPLVVTKIFKGLGIIVGADQVEVLYGTADPTAGLGVVANLGSLYLRKNGATGELWHKTAAGDTIWSKMLDSAGASTEDGYQNAYTGKTGLGSETPVYTDEWHIIDGDSLALAISKLDTYLGEDPTPVARTQNPIATPTPGYQEFGLAGIIAGNNSPLADATYKFKMAKDGHAAVGYTITVAAGPITNTALMALVNTQISAIALMTIVAGDFRITSLDKGATSSIALTAGGAVDLFGASGLNCTPDASVPGTDAGTVNSNVSALDAAIGTDAHLVSTNIVKTNKTTNENLSALDAELKARNPYKIVIPNQDCDPAFVADSVVLANYWSALWKITVRETGTPANVHSLVMNCAWAGAVIDWDKFAVVELGAVIAGLTIEPAINVANVELQIYATNNLDIRIERILS